jgi:GH35 family endo-1,4-beta-xylanase
MGSSVSVVQTRSEVERRIDLEAEIDLEEERRVEGMVRFGLVDERSQGEGRVGEQQDRHSTFLVDLDLEVVLCHKAVAEKAAKDRGKAYRQPNREC